MPSFIRAYPPAQPAPGPALWLPFRKGEIVVPAPAEDGGALTLLHGDETLPSPLSAEPPLYLGTLDGAPCRACRVPDDVALPDGWQTVSLRALFGRVPEEVWGLAAYASEMLYWQRTSGFCPVCGHATEAKDHDWGRQCPNCGHSRYPLVTPAVLILVRDAEDRVLLAHRTGGSTMYSILAGFVEPGESLEECATREVLEEVGLHVTDVTYVGSQPWPFPHQLMVGFFARTVGGPFKLQEDELDDARWCARGDLPPIPPPVSLARQMIDTWAAEG